MFQEYGFKEYFGIIAVIAFIVACFFVRKAAKKLAIDKQECTAERIFSKVLAQSEWTECVRPIEDHGVEFICLAVAENGYRPALQPSRWEKDRKSRLEYDCPPGGRMRSILLRKQHELLSAEQESFRRRIEAYTPCLLMKKEAAKYKQLLWLEVKMSMGINYVTVFYDKRAWSELYILGEAIKSVFEQHGWMVFIEEARFQPNLAQYIMD